MFIEKLQRGITGDYAIMELLERFDEIETSGPMEKIVLVRVI